MLGKLDIFAPCLVKAGSFAVSIKAGTTVAGTLYSVATAATMPGSPAVGADYRIFTLADGSAPYCIDYATSPTNSDDILVGGFHYSPCSNATGWNSGADNGVTPVPQINAQSIWDIKFRPRCPDVRGMALSRDGRRWVDIYLCGVEHVANGTSRHSVTIATGDALYRPKMPVGYGYSGLTHVPATDWLWANRIAASHGKRLLSYAEFLLDAWGVLDSLGRGNLAITTGLNTTNTPNNGPGWFSGHDKAFTSMIGLIQATGCYYVWGSDLMYGLREGGYGLTPTQETPTITPWYYAAYNGPATGHSAQEKEFSTRGGLYGGKCVSGAGNNRSGSAAADWANGIQTQSPNIAMRFCSDTLILS